MSPGIRHTSETDAGPWQRQDQGAVGSLQTGVTRASSSSPRRPGRGPTRALQTPQRTRGPQSSGGVGGPRTPGSRRCCPCTRCPRAGCMPHRGHDARKPAPGAPESPDGGRLVRPKRDPSTHPAGRAPAAPKLSRAGVGPPPAPSGTAERLRPEKQASVWGHEVPSGGQSPEKKRGFPPPRSTLG